MKCPLVTLGILRPVPDQPFRNLKISGSPSNSGTSCVRPSSCETDTRPIREGRRYSPRVESSCEPFKCTADMGQSSAADTKTRQTPFSSLQKSSGRDLGAWLPFCFGAENDRPRLPPISRGLRIALASSTECGSFWFSSFGPSFRGCISWVD